VPVGFAPHVRSSPATRAWEPLLARNSAGVFELGTVIGEPHTNSRGMLHGGVIATLADNAMGLTLGMALGGNLKGIVTTSLAVDYVGAAQLGQWLQITPRIVKVGRSSGLIDALITADGETIARANANFRLLA
jgi:uncharacterized protein (TIGR00369 family)